MDDVEKTYILLTRRGWKLERRTHDMWIFTNPDGGEHQLWSRLHDPLLLFTHLYRTGFVPRPYLEERDALKLAHHYHLTLLPTVAGWRVLRNDFYVDHTDIKAAICLMVWIITSHPVDAVTLWLQSLGARLTPTPLAFDVAPVDMARILQGDSLKQLGFQVVTHDPQIKRLTIGAIDETR